MIKKILIIDDSPIARKILKSNLQEYDVSEAIDGQSGIEKFKIFRPHVTFLDITMPVMGGLETLQEIIKIDEEAIVIMCTADIQPKSIERAKALGALSVLNKPATKEAVHKELYKANKILNDRDIP